MPHILSPFLYVTSFSLNNSFTAVGCQQNFYLSLGQTGEGLPIQTIKRFGFRNASKPRTLTAKQHQPN